MATLQVSKKLSRIFENILGCTLELTMMNEVNFELWNAGDLLEFEEGSSLAPQYIHSKAMDAVAFPIRKQNEFLGLAVVRGFRDASPQRLMLLGQLMAMVLDYSIKAGDRNERLRMIEERMALLETNSNVIPLRPARFERVLQVTDAEMTSSENVVTAPLMNTPLLLVSTPGYPLNRIAIEIHQISNRWAMVSVEDMPADIFESREKLEELGAMTLFIRDIALLTTNQQIKLAEYLGRAPSDETPHIIAGTTAPIEDLIHDGKLLPFLSRLFTTSEIKDTGKSASEISRELIQASLQQIAQQVREETVDSHQVGANFIPFNAQYFKPDETSTVH